MEISAELEDVCRQWLTVSVKGSVFAVRGNTGIPGGSIEPRAGGGSPERIGAVLGRGEWLCASSSMALMCPGDSDGGRYDPAKETWRHIAALGQAIDEASKISK
jgi:hypothetical protein